MCRSFPKDRHLLSRQRLGGVGVTRCSSRARPNPTLCAKDGDPELVSLQYLLFI
ncbi:unnamed protein product [Mycena citricolor]|uniref:Uncharacterized protein n=1 Tax=Mycena citricolor TaxID=2018698 RepID=A0AAD2HX29_9AGAR|nr:unnamed protein product [Mycena citricolor]